MVSGLEFSHIPISLDAPSRASSNHQLFRASILNFPEVKKHELLALPLPKLTFKWHFNFYNYLN